MNELVETDPRPDEAPVEESRVATAPARARATPPAWRRTAVRVAAGVVLYLVLLVSLHALRGQSAVPIASATAGSDGSTSLATTTRELVGYADSRDFEIDYASAHALTHGRDSYDVSANLFGGIAPAWAVSTANPHPPTLLTLVLPFSVIGYGAALSAWSLAMIFTLIATLRIVGVRLAYSIGIGIILAFTFPGAYGIGNPVPLVGLGIALAYRYRETPVVAGLGIALAAMPKGTGLILALPFLLAGRLRTLLYAAGFYAVTAAVPLAWQRNVWSRYLHAGVHAVDANAGRSDNASLLHGAQHLWGLSNTATVAGLMVVTVGLALAQRDLFWPIGWAIVAVLPIAWMYSVLTLVPLFAFAVLATPRRTGWLALVAAAFALGSPPLGQWPTMMFPIVLVLAAVAFVLIRPKQSTLWLPPALERLLPRPLRAPASTPTSAFA